MVDLCSNLKILGESNGLGMHRAGFPQGKPPVVHRGHSLVRKSKVKVRKRGFSYLLLGNCVVLYQLCSVTCSYSCCFSAGIEGMTPISIPDLVSFQGIPKRFSSKTRSRSCSTYRTSKYYDWANRRHHKGVGLRPKPMTIWGHVLFRVPEL